MKLNGMHISMLGVILGIVLYEIWLKQTKGVW